MGKLVEMDELVECGGKGSQIANFEFASLIIFNNTLTKFWVTHELHGQ